MADPFGSDEEDDDDEDEEENENVQIDEERKSNSTVKAHTPVSMLAKCSLHDVYSVVCFSLIILHSIFYTI